MTMITITDYSQYRPDPTDGQFVYDTYGNVRAKGFITDKNIKHVDDWLHGRISDDELKERIISWS